MGSSGNGSLQHVSGELFKMITGVNISVCLIAGTPSIKKPA
jgi:hypothetical protein